jgi:hypothetical protein
MRNRESLRFSLQFHLLDLTVAENLLSYENRSNRLLDRDRFGDPTSYRDGPQGVEP